MTDAIGGRASSGPSRFLRDLPPPLRHQDTGTVGQPARPVHIGRENPDRDGVVEPVLDLSAVAELEGWVDLRGASGPGPEQNRIFQQFADTLQSFAAEHPLLLTLDDLQWVDHTSASLLFHLGRQLAEAGGRILILGAYRPEEVALDRPSKSSGEGERHPLRKVLGEFERRFGEIRLDLTAADQARRAFPHELRPALRPPSSLPLACSWPRPFVSVPYRPTWCRATVRDRR